MAIKASATVTLSCYRDTESITRYYKLQSSTASAPSKPTVNPPTDWTDAEPSYTSGSTNTLYFCDLTVFSDGTWAYSTVSKSSSYEAAKEAYNKAVAAGDAAASAQEDIDNLEIGGRNLIIGSDISLTGNGAKAFESINLDRINELKGKQVTLSVYIKLEEAVFRRVGVEPSLKNDTVEHYISCWYQGDQSTPITYEGRISVIKTMASGYDDYTSIGQNSIYIQGLTSGTAIISRPKLETGNKPTDWTPAPEDIESEVTALTARVANAELDIDTANAQIELKANQTEVTTLSNNLANNYYTKTQSDANLTVKADEIASTVASTYTTKTEFNDLEIGGRNLFRKSGCGENETTLNEYQSVGSFTQFYNCLTFDPKDTVGEQYTISFWAKSPNGATELKLYNQNNNPRYFYFWVVTLDSALDNEWKYYSHTITNVDMGDTYDDDDSKCRRIEIYAPSQTGVLVKKIKIEKGNRATDWTPAPEDLASSETVQTLASSLTQTASDIRAEFTQSTETLQSNIDDAIKQADAANATTDAKINEIRSWVRVTSTPSLELGASNSNFQTVLTNDKLSFYNSGKEVAYISNQNLYITDATVTNQLNFGKYAWIPSSNGHITLKYMG